MADSEERSKRVAEKLDRFGKKRAKPWAAGESGHPQGRARGSVNLTRALELALKHGGREDWIASIGEVLRDSHHRHFAAVSKLIFERVEGKPQDSTDRLAALVMGRIELHPYRIETALPDEIEEAEEIECQVVDGSGPDPPPGESGPQDASRG